MYSKVIVKNPGQSYVNGLTTADLGMPDYQRALIQHKAYIDALKKCGVSVTHLPASEEFPDSTFVEDTAVLTSTFAVITNPGAPTRNGETKEMKEVLKPFYSNFYYISAPGTLEGGDVLQIEDHFYIGLSTRTNEEGAQQLKDILESENYKATIIPLKEFFHLKTGVTYLDNGVILAAGEFIDHPAFREYRTISVSPEEEYAANCIFVNGTVIFPKGYETTKQKVIEAGYSLLEVDMSEFKKQDGGLTCLSLRF